MRVHCQGKAFIQLHKCLHVGKMFLNNINKHIEVGKNYVFTKVTTDKQMRIHIIKGGKSHIF